MVRQDGGHAVNSMAEPPLPVCSVSITVRDKENPFVNPKACGRCTLLLTHFDRMHLRSQSGILLVAGKVSECFSFFPIPCLRLA